MSPPAFIDHLLYAELLVALGYTRLAEYEVATILETHPEHREALSLLAKIKHVRGELSGTIACWAQLYTLVPHSRMSRMHLLSMLHMAQDPERGAGEFIATGQFQLVRKPAAYLELEEAFRLFLARRPRDAQAHCRQVARRHRERDAGIFKLAALTEAWFFELSGDLPQAKVQLERLGLERGLEKDVDRLLALVSIYERLGGRDDLRAAVSICAHLECELEPMQVLGRLAQLHRRLGNEDEAQTYEARHSQAFARGMHRLTSDDVLAAATQHYVPLSELRRLRPIDKNGGHPSSPCERAISAAFAGKTQEALDLLANPAQAVEERYRADLLWEAGEHQQALHVFFSAVEADPDDLWVVRWLVDRAPQSAAARSGLRRAGLLARMRRTLEQTIRVESTHAALHRQLAWVLELQAAGQAMAVRYHRRAELLEQAAALRQRPIGRVLAAAAYQILGNPRGLIHEIWADRATTEPGRGGQLEAILGTVTAELRAEVQNIFLAMREYARVKFPERTQDVLDFNYTLKITKEDEPSHGSSAGLPTALAFLSVFLQEPAPQDLAATGQVITDAHDVVVVRPIGDAEYKVRGTYHRDLRGILMPQGNREGLVGTPLVPRRVLEEVVLYVSNLDEAIAAFFGEHTFAP